VPDDPPPLSPWQPLDDEPQGHFRVFDVHKRRRRSPETGRETDFFVVESPDWVNVIPLTPGGQVVCVRQYRAGTETVTLEIPGGMVDPEDDDAVAAGRREMVEETGYTTDDLVDLGAVNPNPAIQTNRCHTVLARNVRKTGPQRLDGSEEIDVILVDLDAIPGLIVDGTITHSLVVAAFYLFDYHDRA